MSRKALLYDKNELLSCPLHDHFINFLANFRRISTQISRNGNSEICMETRAAQFCRARALYRSLETILSLFFEDQKEKFQNRLNFFLIAHAMDFDAHITQIIYEFRHIKL